MAVVGAVQELLMIMLLVMLAIEQRVKGTPGLLLLIWIHLALLEVEEVLVLPAPQILGILHMLEAMAEVALPQL